MFRAHELRQSCKQCMLPFHLRPDTVRMQIADIRYTSKAAFTGSALHILHRGTNYIVYIATAQETGLKLLLKAYDIGKHLFQNLSTCLEHTDLPGPTAMFEQAGRPIP